MKGCSKETSNTQQAVDLNDFTIIKEGEAEILMHAKNDVFYNKTQSHANRYKRYIVPVFSVQMDFYLRVFVRIYTSMKNTPLKLSYFYQCTGCDSFHLQPLGRTVSENNSVKGIFLDLVQLFHKNAAIVAKSIIWGDLYGLPLFMIKNGVSSILADVRSQKDRYPAYDRISAVLTTTISEELSDVPLFLRACIICVPH